MNNASEFVLLVVYVLLLLILLLFAAFAFALVHKQRLRNYRMKILEMEQKAETERLSLKLEVQEEAYKTVSREIHDNIGQVLGSVSLILQTEAAKEKNDRSDEVLKNSVTRIMRSIDDVRNLSQMLNGTRIEHIGLIGSIRRELAYLTSTKAIAATLLHPEDDQMPALTGAQALLLFRIAQEAIHNIIRHAKATSLEIMIRSASGKKILTMDVTDNGIGFDRTLINNQGLGLVTMQERAKMLGGSLTIVENREGGSKVSLKLKL